MPPPLSGKQSAALRWLTTGQRQLVMAASPRSGKTRVAMLMLLLHARRYTDRHLAIAGVSQEAVDRNALPYLKEYAARLRMPVSHNRSKHFLDLPGGNRIYTFGLGDERTADAIMGMTLAGVCLDELGLMPRAAYDNAFSRLSVAGSLLVATMNRQGPYHWAERDVIGQIQSGALDGSVLEMTMRDNPYLPAAVIAAYERQYAASPTLYQRWILNTPAAAEGAVYPPPQIVTDDVAAHMTAWGADWGYAAPTAVLELAWTGDYWYVRAERVVAGLQPSEQAAALAGWERPQWVVVDSAAPEFIDALRRAGHDVRLAQKQVGAGVQRLSQALADGHIRIHARCENTLRELANLVWAPARADGQERPKKGDDHTTDALRYAAMEIAGAGRVAVYAKPIGL